MKTLQKIILTLLMSGVFSLFVPQSIFSQTESLDIVTYTPPQGWEKTSKEGAVVYTDVNKATNAFCVLTVYSGTVSAGSPQKDFADEWARFVLAPFHAAGTPETRSKTTPDGWHLTYGGAQIELGGGIKAAAILTVFTGFGKTASILAILNDESYTARAEAFVAGVTLDKKKPIAEQSLANQMAPPLNSNSAAVRDPFPDKPGFQPQKPLTGQLKSSITIADLAGTWDTGGANVTGYVNSGTGNYAGTDTSFFGESYTIRSNGTFDFRFQGRTANHTVREAGSGTVTLEGPFIRVAFTSGDRRGTSYRYQFIAFMTLPGGGAVLSLIHIADNDSGYDAKQLYYSCGHAQGYITCSSGDVWTLRTTGR